MFCCFKEAVILFGDATEFLSDISNFKCDYINNNDVVDWKHIFEKIFDNNNNKIFYLLKIFNQCGINISDEMIWLGKNRNEIIHKIISEIPQNMKSEIYIGGLHDRNKTILSVIVDISKKSGYEGKDFKEIQQIYAKLTAKSGVRFEAVNKDYNDILYYFKKTDFERSNVADQYVYAYIRVVKEKIVNYIDGGSLQENVFELHCLWNIGFNLIKLNMKKFAYISFYVDIYRCFCFLSAVLKCVNINDLFVYERKQIEISLEICAMESVVKTYLNSALNILTFYFDSIDDKKLKFAMHKIQVAKRCAYLLNDIRIHEQVKLYEDNFGYVIKCYRKNKKLDNKILLKFINNDKK